MTAQERLNRQPSDSSSVLHSHDAMPEKKKSDGTKSIAQSAGNQAMTQMLSQSQNEGTPLQDGFREQMERRLGISLANVRIRDDAAAHDSAAAIDAHAFTSGDQIVMGSNAPSMGDPGGEDFLAHELAHVAQQKKASTIQSKVNAPGDRFEAEANSFAQAPPGQSMNMSGGAVPAVQRQPIDSLKMRKDIPNASRAQVEQAILTFFQKAQAAQEDNKFHFNDQVKAALRVLANASAPGVGPSGDLGRAQRVMSMDNLLSGTAADPAELAKRAAQILPDPFDGATLKKLEIMPVADAPKGLIERTKESAEKNLKTPDDPNKDLVPDPKKRMDEEMDKMRAARGGPQAHGIGPIAIDPFAIGRVITDMRKKPAKPAIRARDFPAVEEAIKKIAPGALMPPEAKGKSNADEFVDQAQDVARGLAADLDIAQQKNQSTVELRLPPAYHRSQSREAMINAIESIVQTIRQALPHHASNVQNVDLFFGEFRAKRITSGSGE